MYGFIILTAAALLTLQHVSGLREEGAGQHLDMVSGCHPGQRRFSVHSDNDPVQAEKKLIESLLMSDSKDGKQKVLDKFFRKQKNNNDVIEDIFERDGAAGSIFSALGNDKNRVMAAKLMAKHQCHISSKVAVGALDGFDTKAAKFGCIEVMAPCIQDLQKVPLIFKHFGAEALGRLADVLAKNAKGELSAGSLQDLVNQTEAAPGEGLEVMRAFKNRVKATTQERKRLVLALQTPDEQMEAKRFFGFFARASTQDSIALWWKLKETDAEKQEEVFKEFFEQRFELRVIAEEWIAPILGVLKVQDEMPKIAKVIAMNMERISLETVKAAKKQTSWPVRARRIAEALCDRVEAQELDSCLSA